MSIQTAHAVIDAASQRCTFHPVREWLGTLTWDGQPRMAGLVDPGWLTTWLGAEDSPYIRRVGRMFLISMVARVQRPGCHVRTVPTLEGPQLLGKSSALNILAGDWYSDSLSDIGSKDSYQDLRGVWLIELGELAGLSRAEITTIKHYLSKRRDNYRPSYGCRSVNVPRQNVFAGTTNASEYLRDETGGSRFLPIACGKIDLDGLAKVRDQLMAEALAALRAEEHWWLAQGDPLLDVFTSEQEARREIHPWESKIMEWVTPKASVSIAEVLSDCLDIDTGKARGADGKLVSGILTHVLGWTRRLDASGCARYYAPPGSVSECTDKALTHHVEAAARVLHDAGYAVEVVTGRQGCDIRVRRTTDSDVDFIAESIMDSV